MKKLLSLMAMAALTISGCATGDYGDPKDVCIDTFPGHLNIFYDDSELRVEPATKKIKKGQNFEFVLKPGRDFVGKDVKIEAEDARARWLNGEFNKEKNGKDTFLICVPADLEKGEEFKYSVIVQDVGMLDPRVKVID